MTGGVSGTSLPRPGLASTDRRGTRYTRRVRRLLTPAALVLCVAAAGCGATENAAAVRHDLLRAQDRLAAAERQLRDARADLAASEAETLALRDRLSAAGTVVAEAPEQTRALGRVAGVAFADLLTGPLDRDDAPGDEVLAVVLAPVDADGEPVKAAGAVSLDLTDLAAAGDARDVAAWAFGPAEAADRWRATALGSGYRFRLPLPPGDGDPGGSPRTLHLHARFETADGRAFDATKAVTVAPRAGGKLAGTQPPAPAVAGGADPFAPF